MIWINILRTLKIGDEAGVNIPKTWRTTNVSFLNFYKKKLPNLLDSWSQRRMIGI